MRRAIVTFLAVSILAGMGHAASAQTIKLGTLAPQGSPWYEIIRDMSGAWKQASSGRIDIRIYPGGVAGDESDMIRKMRIGQLHAALVSSGGLADIAPEIRALQMPMMFRTDDELDYVMERMGPSLGRIMESRGFKVLYWGGGGWIHFFTQEPVVTPDDLKPLKLFAWAGGGYIEAWKAAGFRPVPLASTDIHVSLQSGLINAIAVPPIAALSFQWFGLAPHMTDVRWAPLVGAVVISTRTWEAIPDAVKPRLLEAAREAGERTRRAVRALGEDSVEVMKKHGLVVHGVPPEIMQRWEESARASYPNLVGRVVPAETLAEVERLLNDYGNREPYP